MNTQTKVCLCVSPQTESVPQQGQAMERRRTSAILAEQRRSSSPFVCPAVLLRSEEQQSIQTAPPTEPAFLPESNAPPALLPVQDQ